MDTEIEKYMGEQSSLMLFRFMSVDADTLKDARALIEWSNKTNVDLEMVGRSGDYFDRNTRLIKEEKLKAISLDKKAFSVMSTALIFLSVPFFLSLFTSSAILQFKSSKRWFLLGSDSASALFVGNSAEFIKDQCLVPKLGGVAKSGFTPSDAASLCDIWRTKDVDAYVRKTVHQQRVASGWALLMFFIFAFRSWRGVGKANAAQKVHELLGQTTPGQARSS